MRQDDIEKIFQLAVDRLTEAADKQEALLGHNAEEKLPSFALEEIGENDVEKQQALANLIREMKVPQKIKLALFGNQTARSILIRDTNRLIPQFVLQNARMTENEIYEIARNNQIDEAVLRTVANDSAWMKSYNIKLAIVSNPKVTADVSLRWLKFIKDKDLRYLSKSRNVPQLISSQARKLLEKRDRSPGG